MRQTEQLRQTIEEILQQQSFTNPKEATPEQLHNSVGTAVVSQIMGDWNKTEEQRRNNRRASYFSAEYLMGRMVYNNLLCLDLLEEVDEALKGLGTSLEALEEIEDAALGNGGLGRLAACFLDSGATIGVPLDGYGIRYQYGIFKQEIVDGNQQEEADDWTRFGDPWSVRRDKETVTVSFADQQVYAVPYDMPIFGYQAKEIATLRLWQAEPLKPFDFSLFNDQQYDQSVEDSNRAQDISRVLYPNDDRHEGKLLRLRQQYFFCSASIQDLLRKFEAVHGTDYMKFSDFHAIQLNDTHPAIVIPELIRLLTREKQVSFSDACTIAQRTFNYTNHTVMAEALETWHVSLFQEILPDIYQILVELDRYLEQTLSEKGIEPETIYRNRILQGDWVHMAHLSIFFSQKVNGVAAIHSEIIKETLFRDWYRMYPERFTNMTNGVTQRRWLALSNIELSRLYTRLLESDDWKKDLSQLEKLKTYGEDPSVIQEFNQIKQLKKDQLAKFLQDQKGIRIDSHTIFDTQIKRIHEYKRQYLNILTILALYFEIKQGHLTDFAPTTFLFGGKAAPGYYRAKGIIKLINEVARLIDNDPLVRQAIQVVFVPNYNVTAAEYLIAATDVSQQISTAGTEASGTGNMKFMMNGAVTLGTYDGANVEIVAEAGRENNYIFGATVEELQELRPHYHPHSIYMEHPLIKQALDTLIDGTLHDGGTGIFGELHSTLLRPTGWSPADNYFLLQDFHSYLETRKQVNQDYKNTLDFGRKCWMNLSQSGKFSSDRTVAEYAKEIWHI